MFDEQLTPPASLGRALDLMRKVWAVDHAARHLSRAMETGLGVTGPQRLVIRVVGKRPGISPSELAALVHLDASTLSGHLQTLTEAGLVERKAMQGDARRASLTLTPKGRRLDVKTPGTVEAAVEAALDGVAESGVAEIEGFLQRLVEELLRQAEACEAASARRKRQRRPRRPLASSRPGRP